MCAFLHLSKDYGGGPLYMRGHLCDGLAIPMAAIRDRSMNFHVDYFLLPIKITIISQDSQGTKVVF